LFALTSWKLLPLALWVSYFAEVGVDLTTKQDKVFSTASTAHICQNFLVKIKHIIYYDGLSFSIAKNMSLN